MSEGMVHLAAALERESQQKLLLLTDAEALVKFSFTQRREFSLADADTEQDQQRKMAHYIEQLDVYISRLAHSVKEINKTKVKQY